MRKSTIAIILVTFLAACAQVAGPASVTPNGMATATPPAETKTPTDLPIPITLPTRITPVNTPTRTLIPTVTGTLPPTITPPNIVPIAADPLALNEDNASRLTRLGIFGTGYPHDVAWSPDGSRLAVATGRGVLLYDGTTFEETGFLDINNSVITLAFHPDGNLLAVADQDADVSVWNIQSRQKVGGFTSGMDCIAGLAYGRRGQIATVGVRQGGVYYDISIIVWNGVTGQRFFIRDVQSPAAKRIFAFSPDGKLFAFGDPEIKLLDLTTGDIIASNELQPLDVAFDAKGSKLLIGFPGNYNIWDYNQDQLIPLNDCNGGAVSGSDLLLCGIQQGTSVIELSTGDTLRQLDFEFPSDPISSRYALREDGGLLAIIDTEGDDHVDIIDTNDAKLIETIPFYGGSIATGMAVLDGKNTDLVAISNGTGQIQLLDIPTMQIVRTLEDGDSFASLAISPDRASLASVSSEGMLRLWNIQTAEQTLTMDLSMELLPEGGSIDYIAWDLDGISLAISGGEVSIYLCNLQSLQSPLTGFNNYNDYHGKSFFFAPNGHLLYFGREWTPNFSNPLIDATTGNIIFTHTPGEISYGEYDGFENTDVIEAAAISPDGKYIAYGTTVGKIYIWDMGTQEMVRRLAGHDVAMWEIYLSSIRKLSFSPQTDLLVSVGINDGTTRLWNIHTGDLLATLNVSGYADFTPDGRYLVTASDGVVRVWGLPSQ